MTLGLAHELGLATAMVLAVVIVVAGGEFPPAAWLLCLGPVVAGGLALRAAVVSAALGTTIGVVSLGVSGFIVATGGLERSVLAGTWLLLGLLIARLLVRRSPAHDLQAILLSLLVVLAGTILNVGISYIVVLMPYAIALVWALSTRQLLAGILPHERQRLRTRRDVVTPAFFLSTAVVSMLVIASAALLFALFPRVGFGDLGAIMGRKSRMPESVGLAGGQPNRGGTDVLARATGVARDAFDSGLYLRSVVYDVVTLDGFARSPVEDEPRTRSVPVGPAPSQGRYEVTALPAVGDTLPTFGGVDAARSISGGTANPNLPVGIAGGSARGELKSVTPLRTPFRYEVVGGLSRVGFIPSSVRRSPPPLGASERAQYLALPDDFDAGLATLVEESATAADEPQARVATIRRFLLEKFSYGVDVQRPQRAPVRDFLLQDRRGHCEVFAAAFTLLLRNAGVPARVVGGFQGGAWDDGVVVFMERHAHAWVEWWLDGVGWIVDDATPMSTAPREELPAFASLLDRVRRFWDDAVVDYSMNDQLDALTRVRRGLGGTGSSPQTLPSIVAAAVVIVLIALAWVLLRRRMRASPHAVHPLAREILEAVARGARSEVTPSMTVREAVQRVPGPPALVHALVDALELYERIRFAGANVEHAVLKRHRRALRRASARLPRGPVRQPRPSTRKGPFS